MGETALVESLVNDAMALVKQLDDDGVSPSFVAWYYYDDADEWRLLIASPNLDSLLQKQEPVAYRKVIGALSKTAPTTMGVSYLKLVPTSSPLLAALRSLVRTDAKSIIRAHFTATTLNNIFMSQVIVLRAT